MGSSGNMRPHVVVRAAGKECQDRAEAIGFDEATVIAVADGAGGIGGGSEAADAVIAGLRQRPPTRDAMVRDGYGVRELLEIDQSLSEAPHGGQAAAVVVAIGHGIVRGASVGDCGAWLIRDGGTETLTAAQAKHPLLGSGAAMPRPFRTVAVPGRLLVATDGLFRYASPGAICAAALRGGMDEATGWLLSLVELPSGAFQDDIAIVLCDLPGM